MKKGAILIMAFIIPLAVMSQNKFEYTPKVKKRVEIKNMTGEISIKNAPGAAIIIESDFEMNRPERAEGLSLLGGMEDNTDLGLYVAEENGVVTISGAVRQVRDFEYNISIPQGIDLSIDYGSPFASEDIEVDSYKGSIEINTLSKNIKLTNSTGPFAVSSVSGDVEVIFSSINQDEPSSLASVSGFVDVSIPTNEKATIEISNVTGNVYNNLDLKSSANEKDGRSAGMEAIKKSGDNSYFLNGGGQKLFLSSVSGNIYIRKK